MTFWQLIGYFVRLGATGFGGPAALADRMRHDLVEARGWISPDEYDMGLAISAASPGPLAFQLAVYCGYVRRGLVGALGVAVAFALAPFVLVVAVAALYASFSASLLLRGIFYGVGPIVVALIVRACWSLGRKTLGSHPVSWLIAVSAFVVSIVTGREPTLAILLAGAVGAVLLAPVVKSSARPAATSGASSSSLSLAVAITTLTTAPTAAAGPSAVFSFFFKTGCFVFGSGLVIAPFLRSAVVSEFQWLTDQQFRDAIAVGLVSPGPVVITATFVGYVVDGLRGALAATVGIFAPAVVFTVVLAPLFARFGADPRVKGFIRGVTTAVVGVLAATAPLIATDAVNDVATFALFGGSLALLAFRKVPEPLVVGAGAAVGVTVRLLAA